MLITHKNTRDRDIKSANFLDFTLTKFQRKSRLGIFAAARLGRQTHAHRRDIVQCSQEKLSSFAVKALSTFSSRLTRLDE